MCPSKTSHMRFSPLSSLQLFNKTRTNYTWGRIFSPGHIFSVLNSKLALCVLSCSGPCRDLWRGRCSKYKRGTWTRLLIGLCSLLICVSKWMLLYWYSSKCHDAGLKKKHRTEKTILSLNVKDIFLHLLITLEWYYYYYYYYCVYRVWWFCCCKHYCCCCRKKYSCLI